MTDSTTKVYFYLFGILTMLSAVLIFAFGNMDITTHSYVQSKISDFSNTCEESGYISPILYQQLVNDLGNSGHAYDIIMTHKSATAVPDAGMGYVSTYNVYNKEDILSQMFPKNSGTSNNYVMKDGDYFHIQVKSMDSTYLTRLLSGITKRPNEIKLIATAGGYVGNTER